MPHRFRLRVYYEDTDFAGIVYFANYFKFIERGRTEFIRSLGIDQGELRLQERLVFVVRRMVSEFHRPAKFDDMICVHTRPLRCSGARIELQQLIYRKDELLFSSEVTLACMKETGKPARVPMIVRSGFPG